MEPVELTADGLLLRAWQPEDVPAVLEACQDSLIQRWTNIPVPYRAEHAQVLIERLTPQGWQTGVSALFGVFDHQDGMLLGSHGLTRIDQATGVAELGTWVAPWARSRRVAERATRAVARWALDVLHLRLLVWRAEVGNHASRLVAERVGFAFDGPARDLIPHRDGHLSDGWRGTLRPGEIARTPPAWVAPGGTGTRRAKLFGGHQPRIVTGGPGDAPGPAGAPILRPLVAADVEPMVTACADPESIRWTNLRVPFTVADAQAVVRTFAPARWARGEGAVFAVAGPSGEYAGRIDLHLNPEDPLIGSIGFLVAPAARGRGYATAAVQAICTWGFETLGLARIEWRAHLGNAASRRVAQKAGFVEEGIQRGGCAQRGERRDAWVAALLAA
ncbi:MAG: GNAT family N-acetyltransferase [Micromonosporaceae bacterium]|nr:GNAT family N-acetyltransferase [Micromonosporaceae bacterium]